MKTDSDPQFAKGSGYYLVLDLGAKAKDVD
jgi:hypothetical protein